MQAKRIARDDAAATTLCGTMYMFMYKVVHVHVQHVHVHVHVVHAHVTCACTKVVSGWSLQLQSCTPYPVRILYVPKSCSDYIVAAVDSAAFSVCSSSPVRCGLPPVLMAPLLQLYASVTCPASEGPKYLQLSDRG